MDWSRVNDEGQQSLESVLARRDSSTRLLMQLSQEEQRRRENERNFKLNEEVRKGALARQIKQDKTADEDRDAARNLAKMDRTRNAAKMLPRGSTISNPQEVADFREAGLGSRLREIARPSSTLQNGDAGPVDTSDFVEGQHEWMGDASQLDAESRLQVAQQRLEETQSRNNDLNEIAQRRAEVAEAQARLAQERLEHHKTQNFAPQIMPGANGDVAVQFSRDGRATNVPLPAGAHKTKTPAEIQAESKARATGTAEGKAAGTPPEGNWLTKLVGGAFGGQAATPPPATTSASKPKVGEMKVYPNGRKAMFDGTGWVAQ